MKSTHPHRTPAWLVSGAILSVFLACGLSACGGDTVVKVEQSTQISKGWELKDLQKAYDAGAVTRDEFDRIKQKLLKRSN
jgi:hypothetical protein